MTSSSLPLFLALVAGAGTALGAVILLILIPSPPPVNTLSAKSASLFGRLQACSAGVMLALSSGLFHEAIPTTGWPTGLFCMVVGFLLMLGIEKLLANSSHSHSQPNHPSSPHLQDLEEGANVSVIESDNSSTDDAALLSPTSMSRTTFPQQHITSPFESFLMNMFGASATISTPNNNGGISRVANTNTIAMVRSSFVTYMGLAIHNLPEGVSVALTTASNVRLGVSLCLAILLHNVLEGMIVALPLWYTSRSRSRVLFLTLLNGLMEPLGVVLAWCLGGAEVIAKPGRIEKMLAGVSGIMAAIAYGELVPSAVEWIEKGGVVVDVKGSRRQIHIRVGAWIIVGIVGGGFVMACADLVLQTLDF
ncbi:ZIP zinc transporter-domain-containing protein [Obelidium mucronatum]|nr:ZIP zinc transporter-domain-containing protein [Obelidium mucronatum]